MLFKMPVSLACMKVSSGRWRVILIRSHLVGRCSVSGGRPADKEIFVQTSLVLSPTISTALHQTCMRERRLVRTEHIACLNRLRTVVSPNPVRKPAVCPLFRHADDPAVLTLPAELCKDTRPSDVFSAGWHYIMVCAHNKHCACHSCSGSLECFSKQRPKYVM